MGRKKKIVEEILTDENIDILLGEGTSEQAISEIETSFGNGDLNLLKEKINELVRAING